MSTAAGGAREQVARLLTLVPLLHARGQLGVEEAAGVLGVPPQQVVKDLRVLFMCGLPGGYPDDLIDVDLDALESDGVIRVSNADYLARPLRLTATEATAVMVALLALRGGVTAETRDVVDRALGKLQAATEDTARVAVVPGGEGRERAEELRSRLGAAVREGRQVRLTYWVPARDEETERVVDPRALVSTGGADYLDAWCHSAEDDRLFRLDRVHEARVLDTPVSRPPAPERDLDGGIFHFEDAERVTLDLDPAAAWVVEYHQCHDVRALPDGGVRAELAVSDARWLRRLLLGLAPHARVVEPAELQQDLVARARDALHLYAAHDVQ